MRDRLRAVSTEAWGWLLVVLGVVAWVAWRDSAMDASRYALCLACIWCDGMLLVSVVETPRRRGRIVGWGIAAALVNGVLGVLLYPKVLLLLALAIPSVVPALAVLAMARVRR